jgi:hypothetical protein
MHADPGQVVVIQAGAGQLPVFQIEAERLHQMQSGTGIRGQPYHIAGIGRDFGLEEDDMKHLNPLWNEGIFVKIKYVTCFFR